MYATDTVNVNPKPDVPCVENSGGGGPPPQAPPQLSVARVDPQLMHAATIAATMARSGARRATQWTLKRTPGPVPALAPRAGLPMPRAYLRCPSTIGALANQALADRIGEEQNRIRALGTRKRVSSVGRRLHEQFSGSDSDAFLHEHPTLGLGHGHFRRQRLPSRDSQTPARVDTAAGSLQPPLRRTARLCRQLAPRTLLSLLRRRRRQL